MKQRVLLLLAKAFEPLKLTIESLILRTKTLSLVRFVRSYEKVGSLELRG